jgi:hypothetical protein
MNESTNNPPSDRSSITEAMTSTLRQPSFLRVMLFLATTVIVLAGIRLGAPVLNPIFFAVVLSLLVSPVYSWLLRRGLPAPLSLVLMLVILIILFVGLSFILGASIARFTERVGFYTSQLNGQVDSLDALIKRLGLSNVDLRDVVKPSALTEALSAVLSGISGFLSNLFLILVIMLFLLGEGPAMMNRLRASASRDNPQVARLTAVGQSVVLQFGLRHRQPRHWSWRNRTAAGAGRGLRASVGDSDILPELHTLHRAGFGGGTRCGIGSCRVRCESGGAGHRWGDSDQHTGRERALTDDDGPWLEHLADDRVLVVCLLGVAAGRAGSVPGAADHPVCGCDVRYLP